MPRPRLTSHDLTTSKTPVRKHARKTTAVQLKRIPSSLALKARGLKVSRKLERESRQRLSSGADPGPSGFDWIELFPKQ
jgi:hypothetical protein